MNNETFQYYENSGYRIPGNKKKTLILDITDNTALSAGSEFNVKLFEPLKIDKQSELYLDNFITFNSMLADNSERSSFCLKINEFNINTNCASSEDESRNTLYNSIIIPNENRNIDNFFTSVSHKAKKFNYICDINPITISSLSGKITDLKGQPVFHGDSNNSNGTKTYALMYITSPWEDSSGVVLGEPVKTHIPSGTEFTLSIGGISSIANCRTIAAFNKDSSNLYFTSSDNSEITIGNYNNKDNVVVKATISQLGTVGISMGSDFTFRTNYPTLISESGRIIAEFSFFSRE